MKEINIRGKKFTEESWERFIKKVAIAEYGDPMMSLRSLDKVLEKQGLEVVILHDGSSELPFFIGVRKGHHKKRMKKLIQKHG